MAWEEEEEEEEEGGVYHQQSVTGEASPWPYLQPRHACASRTYSWPIGVPRQGTGISESILVNTMEPAGPSVHKQRNIPQAMGDWTKALAFATATTAKTEPNATAEAIMARAAGIAIAG